MNINSDADINDLEKRLAEKYKALNKLSMQRSSRVDRKSSNATQLTTNYMIPKADLNANRTVNNQSLFPRGLNKSQMVINKKGDGHTNK